MATTIPGGRYVENGRTVNANGEPIKDEKADAKADAKAESKSKK